MKEYEVIEDRGLTVYPVKEKMTVLITGAGQDSSYLCEHLLDVGGYDVHVLIRRNSTPEHQENRIAHLESQITSHYGDMTDAGALAVLIQKIRPDYVYNLAAQSHVRISFEIPAFTAQVNAIGVLNLLEACRVHAPRARIYQASSSEQFGNSVEPNGTQRETTPMHPVSPYGAAKLYAYHICRIYRDSYNMHVSSGILFNHESPVRRGSNFVTTKIVDGAIKCKLGIIQKLHLGNLESSRDWGFAGDYVKAMRLILEHNSPMDIIIATGETHTVREWCDMSFSELGLDYKNFVESDPKHVRPNELDYLCGDSSRARNLLNWQPEWTFERLLKTMIAERMALIKKQYDLL